MFLYIIRSYNSVVVKRKKCSLVIIDPRFESRKKKIMKIFQIFFFKFLKKSKKEKKIQEFQKIKIKYISPIFSLFNNIIFF